MRTISEEALQNIIERPRYLDMKGIGKGPRAMAYVKIAETLHLLDSTKCISYAEEEFIKEFGENGIALMKHALKKRGIHKPRVVLDNKTIYIWSTK